jgi:Zinc carboxypeptidase
MRRCSSVVLACVVAGLVAPPAAGAGELLTTTLTADRDLPRRCTAQALTGGSGYATRTVTAPAEGMVTARLTGSAPGDWDLALFDAGTGRTLGGSAAFGSSEVATAPVAPGQRVAVQGCRLDGGGRTADLAVSSTTIDLNVKGPKTSLVRVSTPTAARKRELGTLGLDMTEHGGKGFVGVVLRGADDAAALRRANFVYTVETADLAAQSAEDRAADRAFAASVQASSLPSGRDSYRTLVEYENDLKALVQENPGLVKPIELPFKTGEGRTVSGIEITTNVNARDGKPVFLQLGLHHAREWPSGEHAIEWAFELVNGYKAGNQRVRNIVESTRTIVVPVVNPDGFNASRSFGASSDPLGGRGAPNPGEDDETVNIVSHPNEYRRKNCRLQDGSEQANCFAAPALGLAAVGVDPNRNYGGLWGGPGASTDPTNETYRGPGPFSEPETRNIKDLVSKRQVTTLITNHTFSNLVLRPPGVAAQGDPNDEPLLKDLGDAMAAENGYTSQHGYQLYDTTGTTEDWSYPSTGGLGYTFEIGCLDKDPGTGECLVGHFHPPYTEMVKEYEGETPFADAGGDGKGNREAYFIAAESTMNPARHSVIEGTAAAGTVLRLRKSFLTETSPVVSSDGQEGPVQTFEDKLETVMDVPASGVFEWHVNPSTRPAVALDRGAPNSGTPSAPVQFSGSAATPPDGAAPCGDAESDAPTCVNDHPFEVPGAPADNARAVVRVEWNTPGSDWDMRVYRDTDGDGVVDAGEPRVGASQTGTTDFEQTTLAPPGLEPGKYIVRMNNFAASEPYNGTVTFKSKPPFQAAQVESWTLTCETSAGAVLSTHQVTINRGQRTTVTCGRPGAGAGAAAGSPATGGAVRCTDRSAPVSSITRRSLRASRTALSLSGRTRDRGCGRNGAGVVRRVYVAVYRAVRGGCRYLQGNGRLSRRRACRRPIIIRARGTTRWRFNRRARLPRGRYAAWAVGVDARGNQERGRLRGRTVSFRVK